MPSSFTRATMVLGTSPPANVRHALPTSATQVCAAGRGGVIVLSWRSPTIQVDGAPSSDPSGARAMFVVFASILIIWLASHPRRSERSTRLANSVRVPLQPESPSDKSDASPAKCPATWRWPTPNTKSPPGPNTTRPGIGPWVLVSLLSGNTYSGWVWYAIMPGSSVGRGRLFDIFLALCSAYCSKPFP